MTKVGNLPAGITSAAFGTASTSGARAFTPAAAKAAIASQDLIDLAVRATACVGANYAGVDIIQAQDGRFLVLEVNSMPAWNGLQEVSHVRISDHLVDAFLDAALTAPGKVLALLCLMYLVACIRMRETKTRSLILED